MLWPYKLGICAVCLIVAASSGFFYGRSFEREGALKAAVKAYKSASDIKNEVNNYSDYALCLAIGGVPKSSKQNDKCKVFLRRLDKTANSK